MWHHLSCISLCSKDYSHLNQTNVSWLCCGCNHPTVNSFSFHSFNLGDHTENPYYPIRDENISLESFPSPRSPPYSYPPPIFTSTPTNQPPGKTSPTNLIPPLSPSQNSLKTDDSSSCEDKNPYETYCPRRNANLRILNINAQCLRGKIPELKTLIEYTRPDIICISETWLYGKKPGQNPEKGAFLDTEISDSYKVYRNDRNHLGGGVLIMARPEITSIESPKHVTNCEINWTKIRIKNHPDVYIGCFYMPHRKMEDLNELKRSIEMLDKDARNRLTILCGDFNCPDIDWENGSLKEKANGSAIQQELIDLTSQNGLTQLVPETTRGNSLLDLVFTNAPSLVKTTKVIPGISDHDTVLIDTAIRPDLQIPKKRIILLPHKANWPEIRAQCQSLSQNAFFQNAQDTKEIWHLFKQKIQEITTKCIPSKTIKPKSSLPWINHKIRKMIRRKCRLFRKAKKNKNWTTFQAWQKKCRKAIQKAEENYISESIQKGLENNNNKPFWKYVKYKKRDNIGVSPLLKNGTLHIDCKSRAEILLEQFQSVFSNLKTTNLPHTTNRVQESLDVIQIREAGVRKLLARINPNKAAGPDQIPSIILKQCANELAPVITALFQMSINSGESPEDWKKATIAPIYKKGDRQNPENYRPVSLTSVLSKTLEHIICSNILSFFAKHKVLTHLNHGFRSGFSCETQLATTINDLAKNADQNFQTDVAILDFSKAFDTVPHDLLLHKLENYGIRGPLLLWIQNFLCHRKMTVMVDGESSSEADVLSGVPQGTVLGPLLFLCHINDLPESVTSNVRLFADDCLLYRAIKNTQDHLKLQEDLQNLEQWASKWGMKFNAKKCYILSIKKKSSFYYKLSETILEEVKQCPYLGLMIANDLSWSRHIDSVCKKASSTLGFLRRNIRHCPQGTRRLAYISMVRSLLEYGCTIWDPALQRDVDKIEKIQRKAARFITNDHKSRHPGSVTSMLKELGLEQLQERRRKHRLVLLFKIAKGLIPAIPPNQFLTPIPSNKRKIKPVNHRDFSTVNIMAKYEVKNSMGFQLPPVANPAGAYNNSFFVKSIVDWNKLEDIAVTSKSVELFKAKI